jgi:hypothetical protein
VLRCGECHLLGLLHCKIGMGKSGINVIADFKQQDEEEKEEDKPF